MNTDTISKILSLAIMVVVVAMCVCYPQYKGTGTIAYGTNQSLFRPYGELYIGAMPYGPTNIVFSNDFKGTIQIRTNFWRVGDIVQMEWQLNNGIEAVIQSLEALTAKIQRVTAERNQRIRDFAYISALAGYCAATNGVPFERISNRVEQIAVEFFQAP